MNISTGQNVNDVCDSLSRFGFTFLCYDRYGVRKYVDASQNAIFVNREDVVINLYSSLLGSEVDRLELTENGILERRISRARLEANQSKPSKSHPSLDEAWEELAASLPPISDLPNEILDLVEECREALDYAVLWSDYPLDDDPPKGEALRDVHAKVDELKERLPSLNISSVLKLIVSHSTR